MSPYVKESGFQSPASFSLWNPGSWTLVSRKSSKNQESHSSNWNPESKNVESCTWNRESMAWNPESKTLNSLTSSETCGISRKGTQNASVYIKILIAIIFDFAENLHLFSNVPFELWNV